MIDFLEQLELILKSGDDRDVLAQKVLNATLHRFDSETGTIHWLDKEKQMLRLAAQVGLPEVALNGVRAIPVGKGIAGQTVAKGEPVKIYHPPMTTNGSAKTSGICGMVCVPLRFDGKIIGAFGIGTARPHEYTAEETGALEDMGRLIGERLNVRSLVRAGASGQPDPDSVAGLVDAASTAWQSKEFDKSLDCLKRAHRLAPFDPRILLGLGRYHGLRCEFADAEQYFEKAIQVTGQKTGTIVIAGEHCAHFGRHELARAYFDRALKQSRDLPDALVPMAEIHERQQQLDTATELVERALHASNRSNLKALLARARIHRQANQLAEAEQLIRSFVNRPHPDIITRSRAWYELGMILDRMARYDDAMTAFQQAKSLLRPLAAKEMAIQTDMQRRLAVQGKTITKEMLQQWRDAGAQWSPQHRLSVLCGHPRSGTTLLEQVLDAHPDAISSEETMIFQNEAFSTVVNPSLRRQMIEALAAAGDDLIQKARGNYFRFTERFLAQPLGGQLLLDKNPSLTPLIPAVARIFPETRFLIALRDPRDVCLSCFMQYLPVNAISSSYLTIEGTVTEYASVIGFWLEIRDKIASPWLEVRYEDMVGDLEAVARKTLDFLNLPWDERVLAFNQHAKGKIVRSPTYADVGRPIYKTSKGRWHNYRKYLEPHMAALEPFAQAFGYE
ncbi:MAG TPA: sulfotransferase [Verrucomicrobiae bacterium]